MKKIVLVFIICFGVLTGFSQGNNSDFHVPGVYPIQNNVEKQNQKDKKSAAIYSTKEYLSSVNSKIEKLSKKIATAKETKVTKKARAEAIKLMTQPGVIANSKLLSAVQEIYDSAVNKYNELIQGDDKAKAKAEAIAKNN